jgi:non-heme Fe2+,alpha-ketoglutarate-dependent halogenase
MQERENRLVTALMRDGIAPASFSVLSPEEHEELEALLDRLFDDERGALPSSNSSKSRAILCIVGRHPRIDELLQKVLAHDEVIRVLTAVAGGGYKLWTISARYSKPGDGGLALHQDAWGQINLVLRVGPRWTKGGGPAAFAGSHFLPRWTPPRAPREQRAMKVPPSLRRVSWGSPGLARWAARPLLLDTTDLGFLINKTWHMRYPNRGDDINKVLLFGIFTQGGRYVPCIERATIDEYHHELLCRSDTSTGVRPADDGLVEVASRNLDGESFLARIEAVSSIEAGNALAFAKYTVLEGVAQAINVCRRLVRSVATLCARMRGTNGRN